MSGWQYVFLKCQTLCPIACALFKSTQNTCDLKRVQLGNESVNWKEEEIRGSLNYSLL